VLSSIFNSMTLGTLLDKCLLSLSNITHASYWTKYKEVTIKTEDRLCSSTQKYRNGGRSPPFPMTRC
jgi:hypothetical protein